MRVEKLDGRRRHETERLTCAALLIGAVLATGVPACSAPSPTAASKTAAQRLAAQNHADYPRPRVIVASDVEIDDVASWHRFWLYANELDIEGLIYTSSRFHWAGDPEAGIAPLTWGGNKVLEQQIEGYAAAYPNLRRHDRRYPSPDELIGKIRIGNITAPGEMAKNTPGSDLIRQVLLDDKPGAVHLLAWGGTNTFAAALRSIEDQYKSTRDWVRIYDKVVEKARLYIILDQDATYTEYISKNWPDLRTVYNYDQFLSVAYEPFRRIRTPTDINRDYFGPAFMARIVKGPLLKSYPVTTPGDTGEPAPPPAPPPAKAADGGGPILALNLSTGGPQLRPTCPGGSFYVQPALSPERTGGQATRPAPAGAGGADDGAFGAGSLISEGDSPSYWHVLQTGLRGEEDPSWGGWGGRFAKIGKNLWTDRPDIRCAPGPRVRDDIPDADTDAKAESAPLTRWIPALQNDFLARAGWTMLPPDAANHEPVVRVARVSADHSVRPGRTVTVSLETADPDGDALTVTWWQYREAGTYAGQARVTPMPMRSADGATLASAGVAVPDDARPGDTIHVIAEVSDGGTPTLTRYGRFVLTVR